MTRRYLLDSGPAQDYVQRRDPVHARAVRARETGAKIGIATVTLGELAGGLGRSQSADQQLRCLRRALTDLIIWPFEAGAAWEYGRLIVRLARTGRAMQQIDIQIAAVAFTLGNTTVVSKDSDLTAVPGLAVEDWSLPEPTP